MDAKLRKGGAEQEHKQENDQKQEQELEEEYCADWRSLADMRGLRTS